MKMDCPKCGAKIAYGTDIAGEVYGRFCGKRCGWQEIIGWAR